MDVSDIAASATPSPTLALNARAKEMARAGEDVISFAVGEPDFDTPDNIKQAAHRAIQAGYTKYTAAAGAPELRRAIADKLKADNGLHYEPDQIIVSNGGKQALYMLMLCLAGRGDEVLLPAPYWVSYASQARFCGAVPVAIDTTGNGLRLSPGLLENAITPRSKVLVLNSPCNPTGVVLSESELRSIVEVALAHELWIISDEIYEKLLYDDAKHVSPAGFSDEAYRRVITCNGFSKTYAMTGWRLGYAAGPQEVIRPAVSIQSNITSAPNSIAQKAGVEALTGPDEAARQMRRVFDARRRLVIEGLNAISGVRCVKPRGAFYAFPDCGELMGKNLDGRTIEDSLDLCEALLQEAHIALAPGVAFGAEGYVRLSYATSTENIRKGLERFAGFVARLEG
ncbi:MAG: pyridoxal phosphate-dependent aminotransferase [Planctomycetes bacterium]|nr:pyridoxal phosphate-dependent aminotransferase [Planctomycetota bacterium]